MAKPRPNLEEDWAIRLIIRKTIRPDDAHELGHRLVIVMVFLVTAAAGAVVAHRAFGLMELVTFAW